MDLNQIDTIFSNQKINDESEVRDLYQMIDKYPYFHKPYIILAKHYFDTKDYKFDDMLKQASMRVKDRKELYNYIHTAPQSKAQIDSEHIAVEPIAPIGEITEEDTVIAPSIDEFLEDFNSNTTEIETEEDSEAVENSKLDDNSPILPVEESHVEEIANIELSEDTQEILEDYSNQELIEEKKPIEFEFEGHVIHEDEIDLIADSEIQGEEVPIEFSFSKSFIPEQEEEIETSEPQEEVEQSELEALKKDYVQGIEYNLESTLKQDTNPSDDKSESKDFFAWLKKPEHQDISTSEPEKSEEIESKPDKSLDIIEKFISINPQISRPKREFFNPENMAKKSEVLDLEYVSETLANIYYQQGDLDLAIKAYEKLSLQNPSKQAYFADLIQKIKTERK
ncbi:MAG: tetratricopeptide repeat protein [Bacteroidia bacterium]